MSIRKIESSVCEMSNILFDRNFKTFSHNSPTDAYTLPAMTNINRTGMFYATFIF